MQCGRAFVTFASGPFLSRAVLQQAVLTYDSGAVLVGGRFDWRSTIVNVVMIIYMYLVILVQFLSFLRYLLFLFQ